MARVEVRLEKGDGGVVPVVDEERVLILGQHLSFNYIYIFNSNMSYWESRNRRREQ